MAFLRIIACLLILVGCNKSDDSDLKDRRSDSAVLPLPENAKIVDERTVEDPVLKGALDNLEKTPIAISDSFTRVATLHSGARLFSSPSSSWTRRASVSSRRD